MIRIRVRVRIRIRIRVRGVRLRDRVRVRDRVRIRVLLNTRRYPINNSLTFSQTPLPTPSLHSSLTSLLSPFSSLVSLLSPPQLLNTRLY